MRQNLDKAIKAVSVLIKETQNKNMSWQPAPGIASLLNLAPGGLGVEYIGDYKGDRFKLYRPSPLMPRQLTPYEAYMSLQTSKAVLEAIDIHGNIKHSFPPVSIIDDLYEVVQSQDQEFDKFLDHIIEGE
jgi:hypothetical protein